MQLIFVYNTNSGGLNAVLASLHKIVSLSTYDCNLCAITFGNFSEKEEWKSFREGSEVEMKFLHKDEFLKQYASKWLAKYDFPIVLSLEDLQETSEKNIVNEGLQILISSERLNEIKDTSELIKEIETSLS